MVRRLVVFVMVLVGHAGAFVIGVVGAPQIGLLGAAVLGIVCILHLNDRHPDELDHVGDGATDSNGARMRHVSGNGAVSEK